METILKQDSSKVRPVLRIFFPVHVYTIFILQGSFPVRQLRRNGISRTMLNAYITWGTHTHTSHQLHATLCIIYTGVVGNGLLS